MKNSNVESVMKLLIKEIQKFKDPSVTEISRKGDPFKTLISCILSLRTRDAVTLKASAELFRLASTPSSMLKLSEERIQKAIYPVGFYKTKAKNIKRVCKILIEKYGSIVPDTMEELLQLPNVGRKTANITLVFGHHKEGLPIDTHCHRIPNRLGWIETKSPEETEMVLRKRLPKIYWNDFNNVFVVFGQNICLPVRPKCGQCPITEHCKYYDTVYLKKSKK